MSKLRGTRRRTGLAPLELVLSLPILLCVAALILNIGYVAMWRVRGELVSRDVMWRSRWPRTGVWEAPQQNWPETATVRVEDAADIRDLSRPLFAPVINGPLPNGFRVRDALDPKSGARRGVSGVERPYPLLTRLGTYESGEILNPVLDYKWPCAEMGVHNVSRRSKRLYIFPETDQRHPAALSRASRAMFGMPNWLDLCPLDRDADMLRYRGRYIDFHPRIRHPYPGHTLVVLRLCETDRETVYDEQVTRLVDTLDARGRAQLHRISLLPRRMTDAYLRLYTEAVDWLRARIEAWQAEIEALMHPPPRTPINWPRIRYLRSMIAWAESEIARIEPHLTPLETYKQRIPEIEAELRAELEQLAPAGGG